MSDVTGLIDRLANQPPRTAEPVFFDAVSDLPSGLPALRAKTKKSRTWQETLVNQYTFSNPASFALRPRFYPDSLFYHRLSLADKTVFITHQPMINRLALEASFDVLPENTVLTSLENGEEDGYFLRALRLIRCLNIYFGLASSLEAKTVPLRVDGDKFWYDLLHHATEIFDIEGDIAPIGLVQLIYFRWALTEVKPDLKGLTLRFKPNPTVLRLLTILKTPDQFQGPE